MDPSRVFVPVASRAPVILPRGSLEVAALPFHPEPPLTLRTPPHAHRERGGVEKTPYNDNKELCLCLVVFTSLDGDLVKCDVTRLSGRITEKPRHHVMA